jgi:hypothetical protein
MTFNLTNKDVKEKMKFELNRHKHAIYSHIGYGPTFGSDISVADNAHTTRDSCSNLGFTYEHPQYTRATNDVRKFLAGSYEFQLDEIEVFAKRLIK